MTRRTTPALRQRQTDLTRDLIFGALAEIVAERGVHDVSVQAVADRAGVSHRTVYRHFPTREAMLEGLVGWLESRFEPAGGRALPSSLSELPQVVQRNFAIFDEHANTIRALDALSHGANLLGPFRNRRTAKFREVVARDTAYHLPPEDVSAVAGVLRLLASSRAWRQLTEEHGVATAAAGRAVAWALGRLIEDLLAGRGPAPSQEEP